MSKDAKVALRERYTRLAQDVGGRGGRDSQQNLWCLARHISQSQFTVVVVVVIMVSCWTTFKAGVHPSRSHVVSDFPNPTVGSPIRPKRSTSLNLQE